jgi:two-component system, cell cycle sensor histidine kinase and response regulator CckA
VDLSPGGGAGYDDPWANSVKNSDESAERIERLEAENAALRARLAASATPLAAGLTTREALLVEAERVAHLGSFAWDLATDAVEWSDELYRILGFEPRDVQPSAERFFARVHELDLPRVRDAVASDLAMRELHTIEFRLVRQSGEVRHVRMNGTLLYGGGKAPTHVVGTVLDLTDAVRASERLRRTVDELRSAQRVARLGSWTWDAGTGTIEWSDGMYTLLGLNGDEAPSEALFDRYVHPDDRETVAERRREFVEQGMVTPGEFRVVPVSGGVRVVSSAFQELRDADGNLLGLRGVLQDVTEQKAIEEQLRHSRKMDAVGRLAGGVAHDFNNYLLVLSVHASQLREERHLSAEAMESVEAIQSACERCASLTGQLLTFSRKRPSSTVRERFDLRELVERTAPMLRTVLGAECELLVTGDACPTPIQADAALVEQLLMNLAVNARDAMPGGGRLGIHVESVVRDRPSPRSGERSTTKTYVRMAVQDTGTGIRPEDRGRIFEPFFTTKQAGRGTGLGLAMVYGIVEETGGFIDVESEVGHGTIFLVHFPQTTRTITPVSAARQVSSSVKRSRTVLLVEDIDEVRAVLQEQLEQAGYGVLCATNGREALEILEREGTSVDVVLTDVVMPVMGGIELERRLHARHPEVPCVLMTGYAPGMPGERDAESAVLAKPFSTKELLLALDAVRSSKARVRAATG